MALELKGLKGKALKARANLDALNAAYDKFNEAAPAHLADVDGLATQIECMQQDLEFAAQTLGNSVNGSGASQESPKPMADAEPEPPKIAPAATTESSGTISPETHTRDSTGAVIHR